MSKLNLLSDYFINLEILTYIVDCILRIALYITPSIFPPTLTSFPVPAGKKASPEQDAAATTMFHGRDGVLRVMCIVKFLLYVLFGIKAK